MRPVDLSLFFNATFLSAVGFRGLARPWLAALRGRNTGSGHGILVTLADWLFLLKCRHA